MEINKLGFFRVAAISPKVKVADVDHNIHAIQSAIEAAESENVQMVVFPELSITACSCGDLFLQSALQNKAVEALLSLAGFMREKPSIIAIVGLPLMVGNRLYNVAAVISHEGILGFVPKSTASGSYGQMENRWFSDSSLLKEQSIELQGDKIPISRNGIIFKTPFVNFAVEVGEDLWSAFAPSAQLAAQQADIIFNPSAVSEMVGKHQYLKSLVANQSAKCNIAYVLSNAGVGESTTDNLFAGATVIAENGKLLAEGKRFSLETAITIADIDVDLLRSEKLKNSTSTHHQSTDINVVECELKSVHSDKLCRIIEPHPFLPSKETEDEVLGDVFQIQVHGLAKRLLHIGIKEVVIGISGGLDSTLALLVAAHTFDLLQLPRKNIHGITMPGFGTTSRTYNNAIELMNALNISVKEISIVKSVTQHFLDIGHDVNIHDVTYENAQARERTQILMDYANKINGLVVGTGNMSELALGWATYNGDHMSMYAVNAGIPKTLVSTLARWIALTSSDEKARDILLDIVNTPFSPELLPAGKDEQITQETESFVGPYELHDFFLYRMFRYGDSPTRIMFLTQQAFADKYSQDEIRKWLKVFYRRFFAQQFKRSCMPDGPRVGSVNLSPRGAWQMPSDAVVKAWLDELK